MVSKEELEAWRSRWERARATGGEEERERMAEEVERDLVFLGVTAVEDELQVTCFHYICFVSDTSVTRIFFFRTMSYLQCLACFRLD